MIGFSEYLEAERPGHADSVRRPARQPILIVEPAPDDARHVVRCLEGLKQSVCLAVSAEEAMDLLRRELFTRAVVAAEAMLDGRPLLARIAGLPTLEHVVATGPAEDARMETRARIAGAHLYLPRPVSAKRLARALRIGDAEEVRPRRSGGKAS